MDLNKKSGFKFNSAVQEYLKSFKKIPDWQWLREEMAFYAAPDVEYELREEFEKLYISVVDQSHVLWKRYLRKESLTQSSWPDILYEKFKIKITYYVRLAVEILIKDVKNHEISEYLNVQVDKDKIDHFKIDYHGIRIRILNILGIDFEPSNMKNVIAESMKNFPWIDNGGEW